METHSTDYILDADIAVHNFLCSVSHLCEIEKEIEPHDIDHLEMVLKPLFNMFKRKKAEMNYAYQAKVA